LTLRIDSSQFVAKMVGNSPEELTRSIQGLAASAPSKGLRIVSTELSPDGLRANVTLEQGAAEVPRPPTTAHHRTAGSIVKLKAASRAELQTKLDELRRRCRRAGLDVTDCKEEDSGRACAVTVRISWNSCLNYVGAVLRKLSQTTEWMATPALLESICDKLKALGNCLFVILRVLRLPDLDLSLSFPSTIASVRVVSAQLLSKVGEMTQAAKDQGLKLLEGDTEKQLKQATKCSGGVPAFFAPE